MEIHIQANSNNTLTVLDLLEQQGFSLPCNCHGANVCGGVQYDFPCGMVPKAPLTVCLPDATSSAQITGLSLMQTPDLSAGQPSNRYRHYHHCHGLLPFCEKKHFLF